MSPVSTWFSMIVYLILACCTRTPKYQKEEKEEKKENRAVISYPKWLELK
jgi:hypothetical protein